MPHPPLVGSKRKTVSSALAQPLKFVGLFQTAVIVTNPFGPEPDVIRRVDRRGRGSLDVKDRHFGAIEIRAKFLVGARGLVAVVGQVAGVLRIVSFMLQHVGNEDERLRNFFRRSAGETLDRDALNRFHDWGGFARQRTKPDLQRVFERLHENLTPSPFRQGWGGGIFAQDRTVAWTTSRSDRASARDPRVRQTQL